MARPATVVIGAGIVGCLIAHELAERDLHASVTVVDRDAVGSGASRRSAGLHVPRGATPRSRQMSARSHAYYARLLARCPDLPIHPIGAAVITSRPAGEGLGSAYLDQADPVPCAGGPSGSSVRDAVGLPDGATAWRITGCHYADVYQLAQAMAAGLRQRVRFMEGVAVTALESAGGTVTVRCGTGEQLAADSVVLAPGPWLRDPAWRERVDPLGLRVKKVVALHIEQRPDPADEAVIFEDEDAFLLPLAHRGHWLFSYTCQDWNVEPDGPATGLTAADVHAARGCLRRYSPSMAGACGAGRVFCDAYSPGREPVVQVLDEARRIVFAGAASGSGYRLGPAIASEVADLLQVQRSEGVTNDHQYV
jgi:D-arginine dehydrogenase